MSFSVMECNKLYLLRYSEEIVADILVMFYSPVYHLGYLISTIVLF